MEGSTEHRPMSPGPAGVKATVTATGLLPAATGAGGVDGGGHGGKALAPTITFSTKGVRGMVHGAGETIRNSSTRSSSMDSTHDAPEHLGHDLLLLASSSSSSFLHVKGQQQQQQQESELEEGEIAQEEEEDAAAVMDVMRPAGMASAISTPVKDAMSSSPSSSSLGTPCPNSPTAAGTAVDAMRAAAAAASPPPAPTHRRESSAVGEAAQSPALPRLNLQQPQQPRQEAGKPHATKSPSSLLAGLKEAEREAACVLRTLSASSSSSACNSPAPLASFSPFTGPRWAQPPEQQQQQQHHHHHQPQTIAAARPEPSSESLNSAATKQSRWQAMLEEGEADSDEDDNVIVMLHPDEQRRLQQKQQRQQQQQQQQRRRRRPGSAFSLSSASGSDSEEDSDVSVAEQAGTGGSSKKPFPTRKERRLLRQRDRAYHDSWQRIGYYKRCAEKYGAGAQAAYDSEDSEYEGREEADPQLLQQLASPGLSHAAASQYIRGTAGPFSGDFDEVRTTMLKIDALAAAAASVAAARGAGSGAPPKYLREWGKKVRRRDGAALLKQQLKEQQQCLQQRLRRERSRGGGDGAEEQDAELGSPFSSSKSGRERAGSFAGSATGSVGGGSASFPGSPFSMPGSAMSVAAFSPASSPQRKQGKKEKGPGSSGKRGGGGGGCSKRFRIPGMPAPKRQSTALSLSYEKQPDGLIKCKRCGKPNFKNEFALRSHLSHCPGTIQMKEQRIKVEAGLLAPDSISVPVFADDGTGQLPAWVPNFSSSNSNLSAQGSSRSCDGGHSSGSPSPSKPPKHTRLPSAASSASSSGASSHAPPSHYAHALAPAPFPHGAAVASSASSAPALPSPLALARQQSDASSFSSGPASPAPVFEGTPLVGSALEEGECLVGCTVAYKPRDVEEWADVRIKNYRSRRNTHLVVYPDTSVEWVVLTDRNCRLPPGLARPQEEGEEDGERAAAAAAAAAASTDSVADSTASSSLARNAFFSEQEALLSSARGGPGSVKRKASDGGEGGDGGSSVASSVSDGRFATPQQQPQQPGAAAAAATATAAGEEYDEHAEHHKAMKMAPAASPSASPAPSPYHHPHYAHPHAFSMVHGAPSGAGHLSALASQFACRRCLQTFHNKQALGWHTRKGCHGVAHLTGGDGGSSPGSSSSTGGSYALPPPPPAMPIMHGYIPGPYGQPQQHHGMVPPPPSPPMHYYAPAYHGGRGF